MTHNPNVYGYVNGKPVFSRDEFIFEHRKRGPIEDDAELIAFAEKATSGWHNAGWSHSFISFYLSDYALSEPFASLTLSEFGRLKELQQEAREAFEKLADALREIAAKLAEALKPVINVVLSAFKKLWKVSAKAIGVPPKWLHLAAHAKKARTRKKYRNRIRRYVFEALAAEGGGGP